MNRQKFQQRIAERLLVADGAIGTLLVSRGFPADHNKALASLEAPDLVREIHEDYLMAGADIIETNTFDANRVKLAAIGREADLDRTNREAARLARESAQGEYALVAGCVGPLGVFVHPYGKLSVGDVRAIYSEQIRVLVESGVDLLFVESMGSLLEAIEAIGAARALSADLPIVAMASFSGDGRTRLGESVAQVFAELARAGADLVGANCTLGPEETLEVLRAGVGSAGVPLAVQPNAGYPSVIAGRSYFSSSPEYVAAFAPAFVDEGAVLLGGCCGTTPEHIRALKAATASLRPVARAARPVVESARPEAPYPIRSQEAPAEVSPLRRKLGREFVTTAEVEPPRGIDLREALGQARLLAAAGVDALGVPDNPNARLRMSPVAFAHLLTRQLGVETIVHFTCRNRNLLGIQSELLGAAALGLRSLLALTGDPASLGDYPQSTSVRDVDALGLARIVRGMNEGVDQSRNPIGEPTDFLIGSTANPSSRDPEAEIGRIAARIEAGVKFFQSQPIFDLPAAMKFLARPEARVVPILSTILPLRNYRQALFFANEIPDFVVPDDVLARLREAQSGGAAAEAECGAAIAIELALALAPISDGIHVLPNGRFDVVGAILTAAREARSDAPPSLAPRRTEAS